MKALLVAAAVLLLFLAPAASARDPPVPAPEPQHQDIFLPQLTACLWKGSYKPVVETPVVTVWHYTCDSRDT